MTSFCEIAGHETGAYARDLDFAGMHVETFFVRGLNAILGAQPAAALAARRPRRNLVLRRQAGRRRRTRRATRIRARASSAKARSPRRPAASRWRWRKLDDQGKLWTFDPAASFTLEATIPANGEVEIEFIAGRSDNAVWASELISRRLGLPPLPERELQTWLYETRAVEPSPALASRWPFAFSTDGATLHLTHRTPRPWAHVMANELGAQRVVVNDGDVYSAFANARQNALTAVPLRQRDDAACRARSSTSRTSTTGETDAPGFAPFQREDATMEIAYEPGVATFVKLRGDLATTYEVFVPPDFPGDMRLLTLSNRGAKPLKLRIAPFFDMALDESPNESAGRLDAERRGRRPALRKQAQRLSFAASRS